MEPDTLPGFISTYAQMELLSNDDAPILQYTLRQKVNTTRDDFDIDNHNPFLSDENESDDETMGNGSENLEAVARPSFAEKCAILLFQTVGEDTSEQYHEADQDQEQPISTSTNIIPVFSDSTFKQHFHMQRSTFERLLELLGKEGVAKTVYCGGRPPLTLERMTMIFLSWLANQESHKEVASRFSVAKSTIHISVMRVSTCLHRIAHRYICWPEEYQLPAIAQQFEQRAAFPGVVGVIGGTHIELDVPIVHHQKYNNERQTKTMILQAVCDANYYFTNCFAGFPGSADDACVFTHSVLGQEIQKNPQNFITGDQYHLLGDVAYPLHAWLIVPFTDSTNLTEDQLRFNTTHAQSLFTITTALNQLKQRFTRLKYVKAKLDQVPQIIISSCVLHNFCLTCDDPIDEPLEFGEETFIRLSAATGTGTELGYRKRLQLMAQICNS